jgi:two-component system, sensor histidine kinase
MVGGLIAVTAPLPDSPIAPDAAAARLAIDAERVRLFNRQVVRVPVGVLFATGFIGYMMAPHVGAGLAWGWAGAALGVFCVRALASAVLLARPPAGARIAAWIRWLTAGATVSGLVAGTAAIFFFSAPPLEWAILTMVLCAWSAAGIAVSVALPAAFYGLVTSFLVPLAIGWVVSEMPLRLPVAGLILFFLFYLVIFARDGSQLVERALRVGFENEELARQLRLSEAEARSARQRAEEANLAKSRFLAAASHDLRQPLHSLTLLLDHAVRTTEEPKMGQTLRQAVRSVESLHELFTGLLDLSRLDAGSLTPEFKPLALGQILERIDNDFRALALGKGLGFECAVSADWVLSDAVMLDRILRNLLDNAVKYTDAGRIAVQVDADEHELRVTVRDSGIGIDAADRGRIFEEYFQARNPARDRARGMGLGLAIVKRLCDLLGHRIDVDSSPGRGSAFTLALPRCEPPPAPADDDAPGAQRTFDALRGKVVALIEDDAGVIDAMRTLLDDWGCHVVVAANAAAVIAQLDAERRAPDAIVADWRLGSTENGLQAIQRLHARFGNKPAALVTGEINLTQLDVPAHVPVTLMRKPLRSDALRDWLLPPPSRA